MRRRLASLSDPWTTEQYAGSFMRSGHVIALVESTESAGRDALTASGPDQLAINADERAAKPRSPSSAMHLPYDKLYDSAIKNMKTSRYFLVV